MSSYRFDPDRGKASPQGLFGRMTQAYLVESNKERARLGFAMIDLEAAARDVISLLVGNSLDYDPDVDASLDVLFGEMSKAYAAAKGVKRGLDLREEMLRILKGDSPHSQYEDIENDYRNDARVLAALRVLQQAKWEAVTWESGGKAIGLGGGWVRMPKWLPRTAREMDDLRRHAMPVESPKEIVEALYPHVGRKRLSS